MDPSEMVSPGDEGWDPYHQTIFLYGADGETEIPISLDEINSATYQSIAMAINYGAQAGASILMLVVVLTLSPRLKALKVSTAINIASLIVSSVRLVLLAHYFMTGWNDFYAFYAFDYSNISDHDIRVSVLTNTLGIIQLILIELSLVLQAWAVVSLWRNPAKLAVFALSTVIAILAVVFRLSFVILQNKQIVESSGSANLRWVVKAMLITTCLSICYFCALFGARLAVHMWQNKSFLPAVNTKSLSAMEVLVMTNGVLMIIPTLFAGLQWANIKNFESGSLTYTSVVLILPLGTLIAQRLATPQFAHTGNSMSGSYNKSVIGRGGANDRGSGTVGTNKNSRNIFSSQGSGSDKALVNKNPLRKKANPIDVELEKIDNDMFDQADTPKGGIMVERAFSRSEEQV